MIGYQKTSCEADLCSFDERLMMKCEVAFQMFRFHKDDVINICMLICFTSTVEKLIILRTEPRFFTST